MLIDNKSKAVFFGSSLLQISAAGRRKKKKKMRKRWGVSETALQQKAAEDVCGGRGASRSDKHSLSINAGTPTVSLLMLGRGLPLRGSTGGDGKTQPG